MRENCIYVCMCMLTVYGLKSVYVMIGMMEKLFVWCTIDCPINKRKWVRILGFQGWLTIRYTTSKSTTINVSSTNFVQIFAAAQSECEWMDSTEILISNAATLLPFTIWFFFLFSFFFDELTWVCYCCCCCFFHIIFDILIGRIPPVCFHSRWFSLIFSLFCLFLFSFLFCFRIEILSAWLNIYAICRSCWLKNGKSF